MERPSRDELVELAHAHAKAEADGDIEATLATLEDDAVYELLPIGLTFRGRPAARRYYEHFFGVFRPTAVGSKLRNEWAGDQGVAQEYVIDLRSADGTIEQFPVLAILTFGECALAGERLYAGEGLLRLMFGPVLEEAREIC
jgi:ketosteroid isomerase-like protein